MSRSLTVIPGTSGPLVPVVENTLPEPTKYALREMLVAFPSQNVSADERTIQLGTYRDAVLGFEQELVVHVVKWLRFHNPRNTPTYTQPPTAQDVHVAIRNRRSEWARQAAEYFFGGFGHDDRGRRRWKRTREILPDCSRALAEKLAAEQYKSGKHDELIHRMTDEAFRELPAELLVGKQQEYEEHRNHLAYLRGMDDRTWHIRRALLIHDRSIRMLSLDESGPDLTEDALMAKTAELVAEFNAAVTEGELTYLGSDAIRCFISNKGLAVPDNGSLWPGELRCIPWRELNGPSLPGDNTAVAEIINLTARKMKG